MLLPSAKHRDFICALSDTREELPTHLYLAEHRKEQEVLLAIIKESEVLSKLGSKAQKMKKRELCKQRGIVYVPTA